MSATMAPLRVTAHLEAGIAHAHDWGIALDGILAGILHTAAKAELLAAGGDHVPLRHQESPEDLPLPLARCGHDGGEWHWAATCSYPVDGHQLPPQIVHWSGRHDHRVATLLTTHSPRHVDDQRGRYRSHWMPLIITPTTAASFDAVGDLERIRELLEPIAAIGKKRAAGHGRVLSWTITHTDRDPWAAGHLHPDGTIGRPIPTACLPDPPTDGDDHDPPRVGTAGIRPPYAHPHRSRRLALPPPVHRDT